MPSRASLCSWVKPSVKSFFLSLPLVIINITQILCTTHTIGIDFGTTKTLVTRLNTEYGRGVTHDYSQAVYRYRKAAAQGHKQAIQQLNQQC